MSKKSISLAFLVLAILLLPGAALGTPGLIGHWKLDEASGTIAHDASGNDFDGTVEGGAAFLGDEGQVGYALNFDGINDYILIPYQPAFNIVGELTIAAWIKQFFNNRGWILVRDTADDSRRYYGLYSGGATREVSFYYQGAAGYIQVKWEPIDIDDYEWHHLAVVMESPVVRLYIDGVPQEEKTMTALMVPGEGGDIKIGRRDPDNYYFKGMLDDVRLYDEALAQEDIDLLVALSHDEGTPENPFLIHTAEEMQAIGANPQNWDKHFRLMDDIDLAAYDGQDGNPSFNIIGNEVLPFSGSFDGNGHTISNFRLHSSSDYAGIFGRVEGEGAEIKNLVLMNAEISAEGSDYVGALVGFLDSGSMIGCGSEGGTVAGNEYVGGLLGMAQNATISNCYSKGTVSGDFYTGVLGGALFGCSVSQSFTEGDVAGENTVGGLAGGVWGTISHCYSKASVTGFELVGGLFGESSADIYCCYANGEVDGIFYVGGLVGMRSSYRALRSYWDIERSGQETEEAGNGKTSEEMTLESTFVGWGSCGVWRIDEGVSPPTLVWENKSGEIMTRTLYGGGTGSADDPYLIRTAEHLSAIATNICDWDKHFKLVADIDLSEYDGENGNPAFSPIGDRALWFAGVFDGGGHTISNFTFESDDEFSSLFAYFGGDLAEIKNVTIRDVDLSLYRGGALVGAMGSGTIKNCGVEGGAISGHVQIGGLVGSNFRGEIVQSYALCDVYANSAVGGFVGTNWEGNIIDCYARGGVTAMDSEGGGLIGGNYGTITRCHAISNVVVGTYWAGGLVGLNDDSGEICYSYARGDAQGEELAGGLAGNNRGLLSNSYSKVHVTGNSRVGGLAGVNEVDVFQNRGHILHCYAAGRVDGREDVGGLVGSNNVGYGEGTITASFWDIEISGQTESDGGTGIPTAEMKRMSTFSDAGWDFTTPVWKTVEETATPSLWWEPYAGGSGTPDDPYLIATAEQLQAVGLNPHDWDRHFRLIADIDLSSTAFHTIGTGSNPFTGVFDGSGRTISNITYKSAEEDPAGVFSIAEGAEIRSLLLDNPVIVAASSYAAGALVGHLDGRIIGCGVEGGNVTGAGNAGGLVGFFNRGSIEDSYAENKVIGGTAVGGLIGNLTEGNMQRCYAAGQLSGGYTLGGVVGRNDLGNVRACYWNTQTSGVQRMCGLQDAGSGCDDGMGRTTEEMRQRATFVGWDFERIWQIKEGAGYPRLILKN